MTSLFCPAILDIDIAMVFYPNSLRTPIGRIDILQEGKSMTDALAAVTKRFTPDKFDTLLKENDGFTDHHPLT